MRKIKKYFKIWWMMSARSTQIALSSRFGAVIFIVGKVLRFAFFFFFLVILLGKTQNILGYSFWQVIFFFATFNLIDTAAQLFMREVYRFRTYVVSGEFDYFLVKPLSPIFRSLFGGSDILDLPILFLSIVFVAISIAQIELISLTGILLYIALVVNALVIAVAFHIAVLALGVLTTEIDNALWMYRDLTQMGRIPVDVYREPLRMIITFIIPVGIMMTFPPQAVMGLLSIFAIGVSFIVSSIFIFFSLLLWNYALTKYSSVSS